MRFYSLPTGFTEHGDLFRAAVCRTWCLRLVNVSFLIVCISMLHFSYFVNSISYGHPRSNLICFDLI